MMGEDSLIKTNNDSVNNSTQQICETAGFGGPSSQITQTKNQLDKEYKL